MISYLHDGFYIGAGGKQTRILEGTGSDADPKRYCEAQLLRRVNYVQRWQEVNVKRGHVSLQIRMITHDTLMG